MRGLVDSRWPFSTGGPRALGGLPWIAIVCLLAGGLVLVAPGPVPSGSNGHADTGVRVAPAPQGEFRASAVTASLARYWGHPGISTASPLPSFRGSSFSPRPAANYSFCNGPPLWAPVANSGVNFSAAISPAHGAGSVPLNVSWTVSVSSGGLPPYSTQVSIWAPVIANFPNTTGVYSFDSNATNGSTVLTTAGLYLMFIEVADATCTQVSSIELALSAWDPALGPAPLTVGAVANGTAAPLIVEYSTSIATVPANWSVLWLTPAPFALSSVATINWTYYLPGSHAATACLVEPSGQPYSCAASPTVDVAGPSIVTIGAQANSSSLPTQLTFWANLSSGAVLPANTTLWLAASNGYNDSFASSNGTSIQLSELVGCGLPWVAVDPNGSCIWTASLSLIGPTTGPDAGALGSVLLSYALAANGSPSNWFPSVTYTYGPTNGSAPLNLSVNVTARGGGSPYTYDLVALGTTSANATGQALPYVAVNGSGWNGSAQNLSLALVNPGVYFVAGEVGDLLGNVVPISLPLVTVVNTPVLAPLTLSPHEVRPASRALVGGLLALEINVTGGVAPYSVLWSFGDGIQAISAPGIEVLHHFARSGSYVPSVTVTDARDHVATAELPAVLVVGAPSTGASHAREILPPVAGPRPPNAPTEAFSWLDGAALVAAGVTAGGAGLAAALLVRREFRREGEALVQGIGEGEERGDRIRP